MKWSKWLDNWDMTKLSINTSFLQMEWEPQTADKDAAWELYIELLTRVSTQQLSKDSGDELTALTSIHALFDITRGVIKNYGRDCGEFTKIAIVILNQIIRPFTSKWHPYIINQDLLTKDKKIEFRNELKIIQKDLSVYTMMLADMAGVEDLTKLEIHN